MLGSAGVIYLSCVPSRLKGRKEYSMGNNFEVKGRRNVVIITRSSVDNAEFGTDAETRPLEQ